MKDVKKKKKKKKKAKRKFKSIDELKKYSEELEQYESD